MTSLEKSSEAVSNGQVVINKKNVGAVMMSEFVGFVLATVAVILGRFRTYCSNAHWSIFSGYDELGHVD